MLNSPLGGRRGIGFGLGRSWQRESAEDWWLAGGIPAANVAGVWQPKGADSLSESYLRIAGDEGYENIDPAIVGGAAPDWNAVNGWDFVTVSNRYLNTGISVTSTMSIIIRFSDAAPTGDNYLYGLTAQTTNSEYWIAPNNQYFSKIKFARFTREDGVSSKISSGVVALAINSLYVNGIFDVTQGAGYLPLTTSYIIIGRQKPTYGDPVAKIQAIAIYDIDISSYVSSLTDAMNAF